MSREQSIAFLRSLKSGPAGVTIYQDTIDDVLAELAAEREKSAGLEREYRDLKSCMDQDESDDRLIRHPSADAMMRESLGQGLFNRLWGPGLEALGKVVDVALNREAAALAAQKAAEERAERVRGMLVECQNVMRSGIPNDMRHRQAERTIDEAIGVLDKALAPQAPAAERPDTTENTK